MDEEPRSVIDEATRGSRALREKFRRQDEERARRAFICALILVAFLTLKFGLHVIP